MHYDPIKRSLGKVFNKTPFLRKLFYHLLDLLLLRSWHVHKTLKQWGYKRKHEELQLLDAGSGFGQYAYYLSKLSKKWTITAVDVKEEQVEDCNQFFSRIGRKNVHFEVADLTKYKQNETFDFILSVDVMEHIEDDRAVFQNFYQSLKPGAMLLISTPSDQGGSDVHEHEEGSFIDEHVRDGYAEDEIIEKLSTAGFNKVNVHYSYGKPGQISWRLSMKYPMLMLNFSKLFFIILPFYYLLTFPFSYFLNYLDVSKKQGSGTGLIVEARK